MKGCKHCILAYPCISGWCRGAPDEVSQAKAEQTSRKLV
jgi:hypothetical protein